MYIKVNILLRHYVGDEQLIQGSMHFLQELSILSR